MMNTPKLLKSRIFHSRLFAIVLVGVLLFSQPTLPASDGLRQLMLAVGTLLVAAGTLGRVYCSAFIGGRKNEQVIRSGPFSVVRNPLYVCSFVAVLGIGLQSGMWLLTVLLAAVFVLYYPLVVAKEEAFLENKFGEPYREYKQQVPRWLPNFALWNEPEQCEAMPPFIRRTALDALAFFAALPAFLLIQFLQHSAVLPVWLTLP